MLVERHKYAAIWFSILAKHLQVSQPGRKLLGANDTVDVFLELEGTSAAAALSINSDLGNNVLNGNLQVRKSSSPRMQVYCGEDDFTFEFGLQDINHFPDISSGY